MGNNNIHPRIASKEKFTWSKYPNATCKIYFSKGKKVDLDRSGNELLTTNGRLTSGWYSPKKGKGTPPGQCDHGGASNGINKDTPNKDGFAKAKQLAMKATTAYVQSIIDEISNDKNLTDEKKDAAVKALFGHGGACDDSGGNVCMAFVIDRSGSM